MDIIITGYVANSDHIGNASESTPLFRTVRFPSVALEGYPALMAHVKTRNPSLLGDTELDLTKVLAYRYDVHVQRIDGLLEVSALPTPYHFQYPSRQHYAVNHKFLEVVDSFLQHANQERSGTWIESVLRAAQTDEQIQRVPLSTWQFLNDAIGNVWAWAGDQNKVCSLQPFAKAKWIEALGIAANQTQPLSNDREEWERLGELCQLADHEALELLLKRASSYLPSPSAQAFQYLASGSVQEEIAEIMSTQRLRDVRIALVRGAFRSLCDAYQVSTQPLAVTPHQLFSGVDLDIKLSSVSTTNKERYAAGAAPMLRRGEMNYLQPLPSVDSIAPLMRLFPNFAEVTEFVMARINLLAKSQWNYIRLPPILLTGDSGAGKTRYCKALSDAMNLPSTVIPFSSVTASWIIAGQDLSWAGSRPGDIATSLLKDHRSNPLILLDEIDKSDAKTLGPFYQLLEKDTARVFCDEFLGVNIDASNIVWVATANSTANIPDPILSRFREFHISNPANCDMPIIATNIYLEFLEREGLADIFARELPQTVIEKLYSQSARKVRIMLEEACQKASARAIGLSGRITLVADDL